HSCWWDATGAPAGSRSRRAGAQARAALLHHVALHRPGRLQPPRGTRGRPLLDLSDASLAGLRGALGDDVVAVHVQAVAGPLLGDPGDRLGQPFGIGAPVRAVVATVVRQPAVPPGGPAHRPRRRPEPDDPRRYPRLLGRGR